MNKRFLLALADFLASGFYSGRSRVLAGTCGTLVAALLYYVSSRLFPALAQPPGLLWLAISTSIIGLISVEFLLRHNYYAARYGGMEKKDPQVIVIDEFAGYYLSLAVAGTVAGSAATDWRCLLIAFVLFRIFDMSKIPPVNYFERLPGAWGVMCDDLVAGLISGLLIRLFYPFC